MEEFAATSRVALFLPFFGTVKDQGTKYPQGQLKSLRPSSICRSVRNKKMRRGSSHIDLKKELRGKNKYC